MHTQARRDLPLESGVLKSPLNDETFFPNAGCTVGTAVHHPLSIPAPPPEPLFPFANVSFSLASG